MIKINNFTIWAFIRFEAQIIGHVVKEGWTPLPALLYTIVMALLITFYCIKI